MMQRYSKTFIINISFGTSKVLHIAKKTYICKEEVTLIHPHAKMIIIHNTYIPFGKKYLAINILGCIFTKGKLSSRQINHEIIHTRQQRELLFVFFFIFYIVEWLFRLAQYRNFYTAYYNISFEREAYANQKNLEYLSSRKPYSWAKYITSKKHKKSTNQQQ